MKTKIRVGIVSLLVMTLVSATVVSAKPEKHTDGYKGNQTGASSYSFDNRDTSSQRANTTKAQSELSDDELAEQAFWDIIEYYLGRDIESADTDNNTEPDMESDDSVSVEDWYDMYEDALEQSDYYNNANTDNMIGVVISDGYVEGLVDRISGAYVVEVLADSPAERGGINVGDLITEFNGMEVKNKEDLLKAVAIARLNDEVTVTVTLVNPRGYYKDIDYKVSVASKKVYSKQQRTHAVKGKQHKH